MRPYAIGLLFAALAACESTRPEEPKKEPSMELGAFSISLTVKDLKASHEFYAKLGFEPVGGDATQNWLVLQNGPATIGLFQGMFDRNILTFNPGWSNDRDNRELDSFTDIRDVQKMLDERGVELTTRADADSEGPASVTLVDPDGNPILLDQHR